MGQSVKHCHANFMMPYFTTLSLTVQEMTYDIENCKSQDVRRNDCGTNRCSRQNGNQKAKNRAGYGKNHGADSHLLKALKNQHGRNSRENHQGWDQKGADKIHGKDDDDGNHSRNQKIVGLYVQPNRLRKVFIKCNGKDLVVKEKEGPDYKNWKDDAEP